MAVPMRNGDGHWRSGEKCCSATQIESNPNSSASTACSSISWCAAGSDWPSISSKVEAPKPNRIDPPKPFLVFLRTLDPRLKTQDSRDPRLKTQVDPRLKTLVLHPAPPAPGREPLL